MPLSSAKTMLGTLCSVISGLLATLVALICLFGTAYRGIEPDVWYWFLSAIGPIYLCLMGNLPATEHEPDLSVKRRDFAGAAVIVCGYLSLVCLVLLTEPIYQSRFEDMLRSSNLWMAPFEWVAILSTSALVRPIEESIKRSPTFIGSATLAVVVLILHLLGAIEGHHIIKFTALVALLVVVPLVVAKSAGLIQSANDSLTGYRYGLELLSGGRFVVQNINAQEIYMGSKFTIHGNVGVAGDNTDAGIINVSGTASGQQGDLAILVEELKKLNKAAAEQATTDADFASIGSLAGAQAAANQGNESAAIDRLKNAGTFALKVAEEIGAKTIEGILKSHLGI